jgi:hypothetical protein
MRDCEEKIDIEEFRSYNMRERERERNEDKNKLKFQEKSHSN